MLRDTTCCRYGTHSLSSVDGDAKPVPRDNTSVGEECARSNVVCKGYWQQHDETAQAIAARSYTLRNLGEFADEGYDLCGTPRCQVYGGMNDECRLCHHVALAS